MGSSREDRATTAMKTKRRTIYLRGYGRTGGRQIDLQARQEQRRQGQNSDRQRLNTGA